MIFTQCFLKNYHIVIILKVCDVNLVEEFEKNLILKLLLSCIISGNFFEGKHVVNHYNDL
jgi:hypothetical protein